jgi:hypothetical protein
LKSHLREENSILKPNFHPDLATTSAPTPQRTREAAEEALPIPGVTRDLAEALNEAGIKNCEVLRNTFSTPF